MAHVSTPYRDEETENITDVEHSLPTPDGQRVTAALENGHSGGSGWSKRKKGMVFGGIGAVVCLILIIAISVSLAGKGGGGGTSSGVQGKAVNTEAFNAVVDYLSGFEGIFGDRNVLTTAGTPQNLAAIWMADDGFAAVPTTDLVDEAFPFVKRYALAVLYYSLSGPSWTNQYSFLTHTEVCERWQQAYTTNAQDTNLVCGVNCDAAGHVTDIFLPYNGLVGSLPTEIHLLPSLSHLSLYGNGITGTLPSTMQTLTELNFLSFEGNFITGSVPSWLGKLTKLEYLNLGFNGFSGALPNELSGMVSLKEASFEWNQITSNIHGAFNGIETLEALFFERNHIQEQLGDDFLANAPDLIHLDLSDNRIQGTLPPHLVNLKLLDVRNNTFTGTLPSFEENGLGLEYLALNDNRFKGPIPTSVGNLQQLAHFDVSNNKLTGAIPTEIGLMTKLQYLFLSNNRFKQGSIPDFSGLTQLIALNMRNANLIGSVPEDLNVSQNLLMLDLSGNDLTDSLPDSLKTLNKLKYLAAYDNKNLDGNLTSICDNDVPTMLVDCTYEIACRKTCCENGNCTILGQQEVTKYLVLGYPRTQTVFSEDVQPQ